MFRIGVIGYGFRVRGVIKLMQSLNAGTEIVAVTDIRNDEIKQYMLGKGQDPSRVAFYTDPDEMLDKENLDGVMIGTRCSLHTQMATKVLARNLPLYVEKPIATNMEDLLTLKNVAAGSRSKVVVGFPLRLTPIVQLAKEIIDSGKVGTVEHVEAYNNVPYGGVYFQYWYRDENETQGLFLQKATHDFDYINYLLGIEPRWVCAMTSKQIYKGDRPAGLRCEDCGDKASCADSPYNPYLGGHGFSEEEDGPSEGMLAASKLKCGFAVDTGNEDSGSALVEYETGMHVSYTQNFFARKKAGKRGATLLGCKGTVEFDWYTDELRVYMHHTPRVESYKFDSAAMAHGGGDLVLVDNFVGILRDEQESKSPLDAGLLSVLMCLKAKESARTRSFQEIRWP